MTIDNHTTFNFLLTFSLEDMEPLFLRVNTYYDFHFEESNPNISHAALANVSMPSVWLQNSTVFHKT